MSLSEVIFRIADSTATVLPFTSGIDFFNGHYLEASVLRISSYFSVGTKQDTLGFVTLQRI